MRRAAASPARLIQSATALLLAALVGLLLAPAALGQTGVPGQPPADPRRDDGLVRQGQMDGGALLLRTDEPGLYVPAPVLKTKIDVAIAGAIGRTVVTQRFKNPAPVFVEGKYIFPLPESAAVDTLRMRVGDRLIEGEIKEREEAKEIYEEAREQGYVASLVEQERPNLFTTSVANIGPGETVVIQIEYQETFAPRDGVFGLRIPLVVAPRYNPEPRVASVKFGPHGWELVGADPVPDAERIVAPVVNPADDAAAGVIRNPVELTVDLKAGFPLGPIRSLYHKVTIAPDGQSGATISIDGEVPADRDFFLSWRPAKLSDPYLTVFAEEKDDARHFLMMLTPPAADAIGDARKPREVIFVQDISGSMSGESIEQARAGLELALKRLQPDDLFNLIVFNDRYGQLFDAPEPATAENLVTAVEAVRALQADGGTEMLPALEAALKDRAPNDQERIRQVIFLTDGAVGNEREMLRLIERD
ncbi:MAG: VIT domain-containing protein, partial [Pseudomonadota bacterium]